MFVTDKPFEPIIMFAGKAVAHPSEEPFKDMRLFLLTNIGLGWKGVPVTNSSLQGTFVNYGQPYPQILDKQRRRRALSY